MLAQSRHHNSGILLNSWILPPWYMRILEERGLKQLRISANLAAQGELVAALKRSTERWAQLQSRFATARRILGDGFGFGLGPAVPAKGRPNLGGPG